MNKHDLGHKMKLIIPAGGKGARLGLHDRPKPMVPIDGKPLLEHQINLAEKYGIRDIFILSGYLPHIVSGYFGTGENFNVRITHLIEENPLGTAGAIKQLEGTLNEKFLVFYGDLFLDIDIDKFLEFDALAPSVATIIVHPNDHPYDSDLVEIDDRNVVTTFHSKHRDTRVFYRNLVNAAVYVLGPEIFRYIPEGEPSDFGKDIFPRMIKDGQTIRAYNTAEYIKDIGTPERLKSVAHDFVSGKVERSAKRHVRPAIFLDRDGTLIPDMHLLHTPEEIELYPYSGPSIKKINESDYLCFLITNQPVVARGLCDISTVKQIHNKLETLLAGSGAYLDNIYFCPHHPDRGYPEENPDFKVDCDCRKPGTGMINAAKMEFNVDLESSWVIGDSTTDIQTGLNANVQTILLRTGKGGKDGKFIARADFVFDTLSEAVDFILDGRRRYEGPIARILERVKSTKVDSPHVISIGGLARSGKSTFINLLSRAMRTYSISCQAVSLDNWLVGANERQAGMTVRERYKYPEIESDIKRMLAGEKVLLSNYDPYSRVTIGSQPVSLNGSRCLIVGGVTALDIGYLRDVSTMKVYFEIDEAVRKERFFSFYRWKGLPEAEIECLYQQRLNDETPYIRESKKYADIVVEVT